MDLSKLSDADLDALEAGDLTRLSEAGLSHLEAQSARPDQTTALERVGKGLRDPIDAGAQLLTRLLPEGLVKAGNKANNWLADKTGLVGRLPEGGVDQQVREAERAYQARRGDSAGTFDPARLGGNIVSPANLGLAWAAPTGGAALLGRMAAGAGTGAASAALQPVTSGDAGTFWADKATQAALGAGLGAAVPAVTAGLGRVVSPNASRNPDLQLLRDRGVQPTIGQTLGGTANRLEEKLTAVPIMGDAIAARRAAAQGQFNTAALNEVLEPLRAVSPQGRVTGVGSGTVDDVHQAVSRAYDQAKQQIGAVRLDQQFYQDVSQLRQLSTGLTPPFQRRFNQALSDLVQGRSPQGVMTAETFKRVDADLGELASRFQGAPTAAGREFGDSIAQLQALLNQQGYRSNPQAQRLLDAADASYARLVRVEQAAKAAGNNEGVFTPAQLTNAVKATDRSARKNSFARGQALMQDLATAGQNVLGNRVPDSGTAGRLMLGVGALGSGALHPGIPAALLTGAAMYSRPMQQLLQLSAASRPAGAQQVAGALEQAAPRLIPLATQAGLQLGEGQ